MSEPRSSPRFDSGLPHDLDAEQSLLGAMLANPSAVIVARGIIAAEEFFRASHGTIYRAIIAMDDRGEPADVVTVSAELERDALLEKVGGKPFIHTLVEICPAATNVRQYAVIVHEMALRRRKRTAAIELQEAWQQADADGEERAFRALAEAMQAQAQTVRSLPFYRACDLAQSMPGKPPVLWSGYVFFGAITLLVAKVKVGKTTLLLMLIAAVMRGRSFLDRQTNKATVILYTEEGRQTIRAVLERVGLLYEPDVHILFKQDTRGISLAQVIAAILAYGRTVARQGSVLLVIDTIAAVSGLVSDDENTSGFAQQTIDAVRPACEAGWAVVLTQHMRKSAGEIEDSARGTSALPGSVDVVVTMKKASSAGHAGRRELEAVGRFDDIPTKLVIELQDGVYQALGDASAVEQAAAREGLLDVLPDRPDQALTEAMLIERLDDTAKRSTVKRALEQLVAQGCVGKEHNIGSAKGRAWGYWLLSSSEGGLDNRLFDSAETAGAIGSEEDPNGLSRVHSLSGQSMIPGSGAG